MKTNREPQTHRVTADARDDADVMDHLAKRCDDGGPLSRDELAIWLRRGATYARRIADVQSVPPAARA